MAANFWNSTHYRNWLRKVDDVYQGSLNLMNKEKPFLSIDEINMIKVIYSQLISQLAEKSKLRQRVAATAIVYFRRYFARNLMREHDPRLIAPVSLYLAAKSEEHSLLAKVIIAQMQQIYISNDHQYPYNITHIYDYEFKIIAALDFDLIIFHPYRPMIQYCSDGKMTDLLSSCWPILNDSYRTDACLRYPPYLIAIACIYIAGTLQDRNMSNWLKKINIDLQELSHITQYLSNLYVNPNKFSCNNINTIKSLNDKLHSNYGNYGSSKMQSNLSSISKKPPASSTRPKISSKIAD